MTSKASRGTLYSQSWSSQAFPVLPRLVSPRCRIPRFRQLPAHPPARRVLINRLTVLWIPMLVGVAINLLAYFITRYLLIKAAKGTSGNIIRGLDRLRYYTGALGIGSSSVLLVDWLRLLALCSRDEATWASGWVSGPSQPMCGHTACLPHVLHYCVSP
jgi:hypothetical protein